MSETDVSAAPKAAPAAAAPGPRFLPRVGSPGYYALLGAVALLVLGPLGGVTTAYTVFSLGVFIGSQVLAGILGSVVTLGYGPEGKHGANYVQTMAASVSSMAAMGALTQAMVWLGMPPPSDWKLVLYFLCVGMFGVGLGMLYTPLLVDRMKLTYPQGLAVANILRALTDPHILRRSVRTLGGGVVGGGLLTWLADQPAVAATGFATAPLGSGMIVGARVSVPAVVVASAGVLMTPWLRERGYLGPHDPFRKIGFLFALGAVLGAATLDLAALAGEAVRRLRAARRERPRAPDPSLRLGRLGLWVGAWAAALLVVASQVLGVPAGWVALAIAVSVPFQMINGISLGITDQNPISSAFIVTVVAMAGLGLRDPLVGLFAGSVVFVSCTVGVDMQQDRSTGWRLGSDRAIQFRFQVVGIVAGALLTVLLSRLFLEAFPVLKENQLLHPELRQGAAAGWQSAMTYKFVGVLATLGESQARTLGVAALGVAAGFAIGLARRGLFKSPGYEAWKARSPANAALDFVLDAVLLASPYAAAFGGFVDFKTALWWGIGGVITSTVNWAAARARRGATAARGPSPEGEIIPEDMSPTSLVGGGLIAGASLYILYVGTSNLIASGALGRLLGP